MEIVVRKDARERLLAAILVIIQVAVKIVPLIVRQVAANLVLKPVRMVVEIRQLKARDVLIVVPLVHHLAMIHVKKDARVIVELPV